MPGELYHQHELTVLKVTSVGHTEMICELQILRHKKCSANLKALWNEAKYKIKQVRFPAIITTACYIQMDDYTLKATVMFYNLTHAAFMKCWVFHLLICFQISMNIKFIMKKICFKSLF